MSVFALYCVDKDSARAKAALAPVVASFLAMMPRTSLGDLYGSTDELVTLAEGGADAVLEGMPPKWLDDLCIVGDQDECVARMRRLAEAGGDSIVLLPAPPTRRKRYFASPRRKSFPVFERLSDTLSIENAATCRSSHPAGAVSSLPAVRSACARASLGRVTA